MPVGPAWRDIAERYKGQAGAVERLTRIVREGTTGATPVHWAGKAAGSAMLPNRVEISEADAASLVRWILSLDN